MFFENQGKLFLQNAKKILLLLENKKIGKICFLFLCSVTLSDFSQDLLTQIQIFTIRMVDIFISLLYKGAVWDRNQVSVSGTETKVQFRYRYRSRNSFFPKPKLYFSTFWEDISFYDLENKPKSLKIIFKYLIFGSKFWFRGPFPFMIEKMPHTISN